MKYSQDKFRSSFWPPSVSSESIPNYKTGLQVLHDKLVQSVHENETLMSYLQKRMDTENQCADLFQLTLPTTPSDSVESTMHAGLKSAFDMVRQEHSDLVHRHHVRASHLDQQVLAPLADFTTTFKQQLQTRHGQLQDEVAEFEHASQTAMLTRSVYWSRCHQLETTHPTFRPPVPAGYQEDEDIPDDDDVFVGGRQRSNSVASEWNVDQGGVRLGTYTVLSYRDVARAMLRMETAIQSQTKKGDAQQWYLGKDIMEWVRDTYGDEETLAICQHLVTLKLLLLATAAGGNKDKQTVMFDVDRSYCVQHNVVERYLRKTRIRRSIDYGPVEEGLLLQVPAVEKQNNTSSSLNVFHGFLDRFNPLKKNSDTIDLKLQSDMYDADMAYKTKINRVEMLRKILEENMFDYFDDMEALEKKRVEIVKQAFITLATVLNDSSVSYDRITLIQETLKPEQDIQYIVEQLKTGFYCPKPILYENYYYGSAINQTFGVPLEEIAQMHGSYVPPLVNKGLRIIEAGFALKREGEMDQAIEDVWTHVLPIKELNKTCEHVNNLAGSRLQEALEHQEHHVIANLICMYLLELPECLLTFDLYEPIKILYASQTNTESRLVPVSKLLATLPSPNYHTLKAFSHHLFKLLQNSSNKKNEQLMNEMIQTFSYVLMRPQVFSSVTMYDQHPKRLLRDILTHYTTIFTKDNTQAQKSSASRSAIVVNHTTALRAETHQVSTLRRALTNIIRRTSSSDMNCIPEEPEIPSPVVVPPHPQKMALFDDPEERSEHPTPTPSGTCTPTTAAAMLLLQEEDKVDIKRLSNDLELILNVEDDDAVEILEIEKKLLSPKTPGRSRASTRGTLDNVELDPFFED